MISEKLLSFFEIKDAYGVTNREKAEQSKVIRRIATTDKNKSFEESDNMSANEYPRGIVVEDGKVIGFGIHIFNEDVYPLQSFEIYLRNCGLTGDLDLSDSTDIIFIDLYHNNISSCNIGSNSNIRILGLQDNEICALDVRKLPACQGIDAGKNKLSSLDVSNNSELVELYINDNNFTEIDLSRNAKLKYFYCRNNRISELDTTANPLLRHLDATGNPMKFIRSLAPQRDEMLPLTVTASNGGYVGLKYNPIYNAQWKETGEWQQSYYAYPCDGYVFYGWYNCDGNIVSTESVWIDEYGMSREITAMFTKK